MKKIALLLLLALTVVACQEVPQADIDGAKKAVADAEAKEAGKYASAELAAAQDAVRALDAEVAVQADKFALFRNYEQTQKLVADVKAKADAAGTAAAANKEKARGEAEAAVTAAQTEVDSAKMSVESLTACKRKPKGFDADVEALKGRADSLGTELEAAKSSSASEDFQGASSRANTVKDQAAALVADVTAAKEKIKCM